MPEVRSLHKRSLNFKKLDKLELVLKNNNIEFARIMFSEKVLNKLLRTMLETKPKYGKMRRSCCFSTVVTVILGV